MPTIYVDQWVYEQVKSTVPEIFNAVELELKFLRTFLKYTAKRCFEYETLKDLLMRAEAVDLYAQRGLKVYFTGPWRKLLTTFNSVVAYVLDEVKSMRSEIRQVHWIVSRSSRSHNRMTNELVIEFIDSLLENLADLVSLKVDLVDPLKIKLKALEGNLRFLRTFLMFAEMRCTGHKKKKIRFISKEKRSTRHEKLNDPWTHAQFVSDNVAYLCYSCLVDEMDADMLDKLVFDLSDLVLKIGLATPEVRQIYIGVLTASSKSLPPYMRTSTGDEIVVDFMESLLENVRELLSAGWTLPMRDQIKILHEELALLRGILMDPLEDYTNTKAVRDLLKQCKVISTKAGSVVYSLYDKEMNEETAKKVYSSLVDLLDKTQLIKAKITKIYLKVPKPCPKFPSTDALGFFDHFLGNLRELLNNSTDTITCLNLPVEPLAEEMQFLRSFLSEIAKQHSEQEKLKVLWTQIIDVAYKAEYIIDSLLVGHGPIWHRMLWLSEVRKEIEVLKAEVTKIGEKKIHDGEVHQDAEISGQASLLATSPEMDEVVVGFEDEEEKILVDLAGGSKKLVTLSIVGTPGLGKTHLAKRIYNNPILKDYFYVSAWCYVSQVYSTRYLLTCILDQVAEPTKKMSEMEDQELAEALYRSLLGKRYFILMDDVWDALRRSFPDDNNGSRIMFTSRFHDLNFRASARKIHHLRSLSDDESWQLLQNKLFQGQSYPSELLDIGKQIAKDCNGLPLAVVVVAGILAKIDKEQHQWREVANSLSSYIVGDPEKRVIKVMELSYKHLPDHLKPCFLYLGAFFENKYISVQKLINFWVAEGFVQKVELRSFENTAEGYLMDLIGRSLIIIAKRRSTGDIKECQVHDLVRDFCLEKAKEENFFQLIKRSPTSDLSGDILEQRRIGWNRGDHILESTKAYNPYVRSLLLFDPYSEPVFIFKTFKLLRVLDLECTYFEIFPGGIMSLAHLRYFAIGGNFDWIPSSIAKLWYLETFIVRGSLFRLPDTLWNMVNLRYLQVPKDGAHLSISSCGRVSRLDNLQTILTIKLSCRDSTAELMKGLANVKNFKCMLREFHGCSEDCNWVPELATLSQLESLNVHCIGKWLHSYEFSLPSNLKKLTMSGFHFPWNEISVIVNLPNLEVLKLRYGAFKGEEWEMGDREFPKLKFLKLEGLDIQKWSGSSDHFPHLEQLVLRNCQQLEEIPSCLADIATLKKIEVSWCSSSLEELVKQIQEEQLDFGNELKVVSKHRASELYKVRNKYASVGLR